MKRIALLHSLKGKILLLACLAVVTVVAVMTATNYLAVAESTRARADADIQAMLSAGRDALGRWDEEQKRVLATAADLVGDADPRRELGVLAKAAGADLVFVAQAEGLRMLLSNPAIELPPGFDPTSRPWWQLAVGAQSATVSAPYADTSGGHLVLTYSLARRAGGAVVGVAGLDIPLAGFVARLKDIKPTADSISFVVDGRGAVLAHPDLKKVNLALGELVPGLSIERLRQIQVGDGFGSVEVGGTRYLIDAQPVANTDWLLAALVPERQAYAALDGLIGKSLGVGLLLALVATAVVGGLVHRFFSRLDAARATMGNIASGEADLTRRLDAGGRDELADIGRSFNAFMGRIADSVTGIRASTESVRSVVGDIAAGNADLAARTEQTAANLEQTAAAMEQLSSSVRHNAATAQQASELVARAGSQLEQGAAAVEQVVKTMAEIRTASQRITDIIGVIDGIAFQTNLLALNAAVEAARAGEQGRGFAVVAAEVRSLAQRCAGAAREVKDLIGASAERVDAGHAQAHEAGARMAEIVESSGRTNQLITEISAATQEQASGIHQVAAAVGNLDQMTQQNAALVEQSAAAADSLREQATRLVEAVAIFRLEAAAIGSQRQAALRIEPTGTAPSRVVPERTAAPAAKVVAPTQPAGAAAADEWQEF